MVAKIDATANDMDPSLKITKFPTILYYKANDKTNPVAYGGKDKTLEPLLQFVKDNARYIFGS